MQLPGVEQMLLFALESAYGLTGANVYILNESKDFDNLNATGILIASFYNSSE